MPSDQANKVSPLTKHMVDISALTGDPIYFALALTLISFVVAGFREELWRAAMLAGINALFPRQFEKLSGQVIGVMIVAVLFGMGHTAEGWAGIAITALLGFGLGAIMLWRRSIWEAVFAHGFFDAGTFAFLYLLARYYPHQL
jgi:membrane protease YdiL (CAAX protease family)